MGRIISTPLLTKMVFILMVYFLITGLYEWQYNGGEEFDVTPLVQGAEDTTPQRERYANLTEDEASQIVLNVTNEFNMEPPFLNRLLGIAPENPELSRDMQAIYDEVERMNAEGNVPYSEKVSYVEVQTRAVLSKYYERVPKGGAAEQASDDGGIIAAVDRIINTIENAINAIGGYFSNLAQAIGQILTIIGKALTFNISVPAEYEPFMQYVRWVVAPAVIIPFSLVLLELILAVLDVIGGWIPFT